MNSEKHHCETYWDNEAEHEWWEQPDQNVLQFIQTQSPEKRPDLLDLGCGLGRHAIAFAQAGYRIVGTN